MQGLSRLSIFLGRLHRRGGCGASGCGDRLPPIEWRGRSPWKVGSALGSGWGGRRDFGSLVRRELMLPHVATTNVPAIALRRSTAVGGTQRRWGRVEMRHKVRGVPRAIRQRFKVTGTGKIMRLQAGRKKKMFKKTSARRLRLKGWKEIARNDYRRVKRMLGVNGKGPWKRVKRSCAQ